jgi:hypothetical protein
VSISHSGLSPHFVSIYQEEYIKNPKEKSDVFEVKTVFKQENKVVKELRKATIT